VHDDQEGRTSDEDELQGPEADVGDGEEVVIADVGAAGLPRVAVKVLLLVPPHALGSHHIHQHPENEDHGEPDAAEGCGILVDPTEQRLQRLPVHGGGWRPEHRVSGCFMLPFHGGKDGGQREPPGNPPWQGQG
uniref:Uncharacterized protein n=1 Tax=Melopsittacus undulatus TaxID=13146 RepID=A0A8C6JU46_MELUD